MKPIGPGTDAELLDKLNSFADGIARSLDSGSVSRDFLRVSAAISARVDMLSPEIMELLDVFDSFAGGIARSLDSGDSGAVNRAYSLASATRLLIALIKDHKAARVNKDVLSQLVTTHFFLRFMDRVLDSGGLTKIAEGVSNGINLKDAWPRAAKLAKAGRGRSTGRKNGAKGRYRTPG